MTEKGSRSPSYVQPRIAVKNSMLRSRSTTGRIIWSSWIAIRESVTPASQRRQAAVDGDHLAGDVARVVAEQEHDGRRDLPRRSLTAERHRRAAAARAALRRAATERRVDQARRNDVRAHALARAFEGDVTAQSTQRGFRRVVCGDARPWAESRDRRDEHDRPAGGHLRQRGTT